LRAYRVIRLMSRINAVSFDLFDDGRVIVQKSNKKCDYNKG
jgi:hypothetical protein